MLAELLDISTYIVLQLKIKIKFWAKALVFIFLRHEIKIMIAKLLNQTKR